MYTNDIILVGPNKDEINSIMNMIKGAKLDVGIAEDLKDFLGVHITKETDGIMHIF